MQRHTSIRIEPLSWLLLAVPLLVLAPSLASADPALRTQMDLRGNFVLLGATLAHECAADVPIPIVGTVDACTDSNLAAPDVYWRADQPSMGEALADDSITAEESRATVMLVLPDDATVVYARLYWGGLVSSNTPDTEVRLERVEDDVDETITADDSTSLAQTGTNSFFYQSTADVTELVIEHAAGPYRVSGVSSSLDNAPTGAVAAWYMIVFYELEGLPSRNLAIFDSLEYVDGSTQSSVTLSGFVVPANGFDAELGVVAYEGEEQYTGDTLSFNGTELSNDLNNADNFFNATRSKFGEPVSTNGDLPRLEGERRSYSNVDLDVMDVTALVSGGDTSATIEASSTLDIYVLSAFVTSISTLLPDFTNTTKEVVDINGGVAAPGDVLEYRIVALNEGTDAAIGVTLTDEIPEGLSFVEGSIRIEEGPGMGEKTDDADDDQGTYDGGSRTVTVHLGADATGDSGGKLAIGEGTEVRFQVTIDDDTRGEVTNQGLIVAAGEQGAAEAESPTDADLTADGQTPTSITVEECEDDTQCDDPTPYCDVGAMPRECVVCAKSAHCEDPELPDCDLDTHTCVCVSGSKTCTDRDMDGISDGGEDELGTDPDDADTDDDGVIDGEEDAPDQDPDGDTVINALDADSDNDGLPDGLEMGLGCNHADTDNAHGTCRPDADMGATKTSPIQRDTDGGGVSDGSEDFNLNGQMDAGETDPTAGHGADDAMVPDMDGDGLGDDLEETLDSDPKDPDTDEDGASDGQEADPAIDHDGDKLNSVLDVDSDNDALFDGTELGFGCDGGGTDASLGHCRADADMGMTKTSPTDADSDDGGVTDGSEDASLNGRVDGAETDPTRGNGEDDASLTDADEDGLSDVLEGVLGTDPNDADSDDDGLLDGEEANPADDHDRDGKINALDHDSDDDNVFDGTELGQDCGSAATNAGPMHCRPDADAGATTTSPVNEDTDFGGIPDGVEDRNQDGVMDATETDPNNRDDDAECDEDNDCGDAVSGLICDMGACRPGCRGDGNGCPDDQVCSSKDGEPGVCLDVVVFRGGGCDCEVGGVTDRQRWSSGLLIVLALLWVGRRRARASR